MTAGSGRVSTLHDAVDAWLEAKRSLEHAMPGTAEWLRLRMIEVDHRAAYLALMERMAGAEDEMRVEPSRLPLAMARPEGFEPPTY